MNMINKLNPWNRVFLQKLITAQQSGNCPPFMEPKELIPAMPNVCYTQTTHAVK